MNYLAIDTSGDLLVMLNVDGQTHIKHLIGCQTKHSLTLMPYIEELLNDANITLKEVDFFAVITGPGSFTGIRIGVSTIKALCFATQKRVISLTSFDLLAYADNAPEKAMCVVNANHGNYYCSAYDNKEIKIEPCFLCKEDIEKYLEEFTVCSIAQEEFSANFVCDVVSGLKNAVEAKINNLQNYSEIVPLYVKRSQAEEESC